MSLKAILDAPYIPMSLSAYAEDARRRLKEAEQYSPTVNVVHQMVRHQAQREELRYTNEEFYVILALELLRENECVREVAEGHRSYNVYGVPCQKPHYEARSLWQMFCLKLGGFR